MTSGRRARPTSCSHFAATALSLARVRCVGKVHCSPCIWRVETRRAANEERTAARNPAQVPPLGRKTTSAREVQPLRQLDPSPTKLLPHHSADVPDPPHPVTIAIQSGDVSITWAARQALMQRLQHLKELFRIRDSFETVDPTRPLVQLSQIQRFVLQQTLLDWSTDGMPAELNELLETLSAEISQSGTQSTNPS